MAETKNLLEGDIGTTLKDLSVPMGVGVIFMILVNLIDTYWASRLGTDELAAMSFAFPVVGIVINVSIGLMIGTSVAVARVVGAGDDLTGRRLAAHSLILGFLLVGIVTGVGISTQDLLFSALGAPEELLPTISRFMTIWYGSAAVLIVPMMLNGVLRARGDAKTPRNVMIFAAVLNAIFDPILIFGWGPIPGYGLEGAAMATALSRVFTFIYAARIALKLNVLDLHIPSADELLTSWKDILSVGLPATLTNVLGPVATALLTAIVAMHGAAAVAAYGIGARVESLVLIAPMALSSGLSPFVGQNYGAHLQKRVAAGFRLATRFSVIWGLGAFLLLLPAAPWIGRAFSDDPEVAKDIALYLRIVPVGYAAYGAVMMVSSAFNAMDHAVRSTMLSVLRSIVIAVPVAWVGSQFLGLPGVFLGLSVGSIVGAVVGMRWMNRFLDPDAVTRTEASQKLDQAGAQFLIEGTAESMRERMKEILDRMQGYGDVELHMIRRDAAGFFVGDRQIGHIHPSGHLDLPLPVELGDELVRRGIVDHHRIHHSAGWYTHLLQNRRDLSEANWLLRLGHLLAELCLVEGEEGKVREELSAIELDAELRVHLERAAARWRAEAA
ncbi:MAG: MATE family efflux transporter [Deltaproteobacteria bacterium]|nr:MATE family efflux transporter [Deltaproteobacteria bacterium]